MDKNILEQAFSMNENLPNLSANWQPDVIVLGPGGVKVYLELGALLKLEVQGYLKNINHYIGCSVGAAISLLVVAGCTITEIIKETLKINMFQDVTDIDSIQEIVEKKGIFNNNQLEKALRRKMIEKFGKDPTFEQLYMATGIKLTIVSYNLTKERPEYFSRDSEPNLSCVSAVMMSMIVPILMQTRTYKENEYIDGALGNPYPVDIVDNGENKILGIYVMTENKNKGTMNFLYRVAHASLNQLRTKILKNSSDKCKHLALSTAITEGLNLTVNNATKSKLVREGYDTANKFISQLRHPEKYKVLLEENEEIPFEISMPLIDLNF